MCFCLGKQILRILCAVRNCGIDECTQPHLRLLHSETGKPPKDETQVKDAQLSASEWMQHHQEEVTSCVASKNEDEKFKRALVHRIKGFDYPILPVLLSNGHDKSVRIHAFIDNFCKISIIENKFMRKLEISEISISSNIS